MVGVFGTASATSLDAVTLPGGEAEVPLSTPEPLPDESPKFRLGGGRVLRIISSMEAPSWAEMLFGGEMLWMVGSE